MANTKDHIPMPPIELVRHMFAIKGRQFVYRGGGEPAGKGCFANRNGSKHRQVSIDGRLYLVSRLAYFLQTGADPGDYVVKHRDGDAEDFRLQSLYLLTINEARAVGRLNTLGTRGTPNNISGVRFQGRSFTASSQRGGKYKYLGSFKSREAAEAAVVKHWQDIGLAA